MGVVNFFTTQIWVQSLWTDFYIHEKSTLNQK